MLTDKEFEEFYAGSYKRIYNYFYYVTMNHHTSEDLTSITFLKFYGYADSFDEKLSSKLTFALKIARNVAIDYFRKNKDREQLIGSDEEPKTSGEEAYEFESSLVDRMLLKKILSELNGRERQIIYYKYYLNMRSEEISDIMNLSVTNVTSICSRSLKKAKKIYENLENDVTKR